MTNPMAQKQWYESLFENYAHKYDKEVYTQGTIGECDFIEDELRHNTSRKIPAAEVAGLPKN